MKKVLFVAYHYPPSKLSGGWMRSFKFVKYLSQFNWEPQVICSDESIDLNAPSDPNSKVISSWTPFSKPYELRPYGWSLHFYFFVRKLIRREKIDLIYLSSPPFIPAISCRLIRKYFDIPYVLDFRDAWSLDPYQEGSRLKKLVYKYVFPSIEESTLRESSLMIANTPSMMRAYREKYDFLSENRIVHIPNGFDPEDFKPRAKLEKGKTFRMVYSGRFGVGDRDPGLLFDSIRVLAQEGLDVQLVLLGDESDYLKSAISHWGVSDLVENVGLLSHAKAIDAQYSADTLIVYQEHSDGIVTPIAGKTFEYLATGRPILAITPEGDNADLVRKYSPRSKVVTSYRVKQIVDAMRSLHQKWSNDSLDSLEPSSEFLKEYSRKSLSKKLAVSFDSLFD